MKKVVVCETVKYYHLIEVDDEVDIDGTVTQASYNSARYDSGCEAIKDLLDKIQEKYGFDYNIKPKYCGIEIEGLNVCDEVE